MNTQDLINNALASERVRASYGVKFAWHQYSDKAPCGVQCELHVNGIDDAHARRLGKIVEFKVVRTVFWYGATRISRAEAEQRLAQASAADIRKHGGYTLTSAGKLKNGADLIEQRGDVVLAKFRAGKCSSFATWKMDTEGNCYWGHYFDDIKAAVADFNQR